MIAYIHAMVKEASKIDSNLSLIYRLIVEELDNCPIRVVSPWLWMSLHPKCNNLIYEIRLTVQVSYG